MHPTEQKVARTARQAGITLLEIMIVLAIIALVMGVLVGPKVFNAFKQAKVDTAYLMTKEYLGGYHRWVADNSDSDCPEKLEDLLKYTNKKDLKDPWGTPFVMKCGDAAPTDERFGVVSVGPDKKEGSDDDIHSWDPKAPRI